MSIDLLQNNQFETLNALSRIPLEVKEKGKALQCLTKLCCQALNSEVCALSSIDLAQECLTYDSISGSHESLIKELTHRRIRLTPSQIPATKNPNFADHAVAEEFGLGILSHPVKLHPPLIGYLIHFSARLGPFTSSEKGLLAMFARQAELLLDKFDHDLQLDLSFKFLNSLSQEILSISPADFLQQVAEKVCELFAVPICIVWERSSRGRRLEIVATSGEVDEDFKRLKLDYHAPGIKSFMSNRKVAYLLDVTAAHGQYLHSAEAKGRGWRSIMSAPMWVENELIGLVDVYTKTSRHFKLWERELFGAFANHAALSIQKTELLEETIKLREREKQEQRNQLVTEIQKAVSKVASVRHAWPKGELSETLNLIVEKCAQATNAKSCFLRLWNRETNCLNLEAFHVEPRFESKIPAGHQVKLGEGISGTVAETGETIMCSDLTQQPHYSKFYISLGISSVICVPIRSGDAVLGTISVGHYKTMAFEQEHRLLLENIVESVAVAIERVNLTDCLLLLEEATVAAESLESLLEQLARFTRDLMREPVCLVWLLDKDRGGFTVKAHTSPEEQNPELDTLFISAKAAGVKRFFQKREPLCFQDASTIESHFYAERIKQLNWKSMLAMPLTFQGRVIGILEVYSYKKRRQFTSWHRRLFNILAVQASIAIESLTNRKRLERLNAINQMVTECRDEEKLLKIILKESLDLVGVTRGCISKLNLRTSQLYTAVQVGNSESLKTLEVKDGITGRAFQLQKPVRVDDVTQPRWRYVYKEFWGDTRSELAVPILITNAEIRVGGDVKLGTRVMGVLNIESPAVGAFSQADENALWSLARHAAVIIENLEFDRKLFNLRQVVAGIVGERDWDEMIENIFKAITESLDFEYVNISMVTPELNHIKSEYVLGIPPSLIEEFKEMTAASLESNDIKADILRSRRIEVPDAQDPRFDRAVYHRFNHEQLVRVFIPMIIPSDSRAIGVVEAGYRRSNRENIYERDVQILKSFVDYAAQSLEQKQRGLLPKISHEFTAPIVGIRNNASFLQKRLAKLSEEVIQLKFEDILTDCELLLHQVNELEHILGGKPPRAKMELTLVHRDIIIKTIKQLRPLVTERGFDVSKISYELADCHRISLYIDKPKLNSVVYNLLINSIKYAEDDPALFKIAINVEETNDSYIIQFKDWGIGIDSNYGERIFEDGFRAPEASSKNITGSGLGLTIARKIMREFGGDLYLANNRRPTEFHLRLPKSLREVSDDSIR